MMLMEWMLKTMTDMGLSTTEQLIYMFMLSKVNADKTVRLTYKDITNILPISMPTAFASIKNLVNVGLINIKQASNVGNVYIVNYL